MKTRPLTPVLWLSILVPSIAHASSFALVLYPSGAITAIVVTGLIFASQRKPSIRVASAAFATLTAVGIGFLPATFYSSKLFENLELWLGEWAFFVLGFVPPSVIALLVLRLGAKASDQRET